MSVFLVPEIWCDRCDVRHQPDINLEPDDLAAWPDDFRDSMASGLEWVYTGDEDLCPDCAEAEGEAS